MGPILSNLTVLHRSL
uniref:Uncharacterized protein n=1 Tax=Anguilla anguilla TaxID=7936 RepID=A0A0E9QE52_ANGAN